LILFTQTSFPVIIVNKSSDVSFYIFLNFTSDLKRGFKPQICFKPTTQRKKRSEMSSLLDRPGCGRHARNYWN